MREKKKKKRKKSSYDMMPSMVLVGGSVRLYYHLYCSSLCFLYVYLQLIYSFFYLEIVQTIWFSFSRRLFRGKNRRENLDSGENTKLKRNWSLRRGKHAQFHPNSCVHCSSKYRHQILKVPLSLSSLSLSLYIYTHTHTL